jgi:hypothetical protein
VANDTSSPSNQVYTRSNEQQAAIFLGATMGHAESHNSFNILFVLTFFASFATVMIQFG